MAELLQLVNTVMILLIKPLSLVKFTCFFGVRTICIVIQTWTELLRAAMGFHARLLWKLIIWAIAVLSLPIRSLTALQRERALEMHLQEMQIEFENLVWERKQLEKKILVAIKDKKIMQAMLAELEDEHDDAIVKIEQLEDQLDNVFPFRHVFLATSKKMDLIERDIEVNWSQKAVASICYNGPLQNLKVENQRLNEVHGKALSDLKDHFDGPVMQGCSDAVPFWRSSGIESVAIHKEGMQEDKSKSGSTSSEFVEARSCRDVNRPRTQTTSEYFDTNDVLQQRRDLAVSQTLFSAILSLLVGTIIWKAEDACMPLVLALFAVVGMSLWSVVQFFSTIRNRPASDAVALLSFNWFLLGTLTYPTLPRITPVFAPVLWTLSDRAVELLGF
ncbi:uncharacterized protein LOC107027106 isoform X1 [Solanum pennellii]|uniref:Uncharacterized protein LOC107027106 isoform X1 n=1 Tax=Solanum pennellii TaxID=28526 RepID=A0ABM1HD38_SOLPN|nr:uncharacterized protein LOC107027106 isoform X1 [Solanum pennellii]XP_027774640.1 uncharacterized protein LOC107027106 isoform X1 [Solanum pennellii]XP_027774641.1 uncharacterized protein LOC107027106 isoform X1 [Solanum pennellii]